MTAFDWHADAIDRDTPVTATYRHTQNVRRFLTAQCGDAFAFDRAFMAWIMDGTAKTMDGGRRRRVETPSRSCRYLTPLS
jgi:hypothetical protein